MNEGTIQSEKKNVCQYYYYSNQQVLYVKMVSEAKAFSHLQLPEAINWGFYVTRPTIKLATTRSTIYEGVGLLSERLILTYTGSKTTGNVKLGSWHYRTLI
jgi:hypothetical protein